MEKYWQKGVVNCVKNGGMYGRRDYSPAETGNISVLDLVKYGSIIDLIIFI